MRVVDAPVPARGDQRPSTVGAIKGGPMESGTDVFAVLGWGLRRYAVLLAAVVLAVGVLVPMALGQRQAEYQATAQVGPTSKLLLPNLNPLPRLGESVFNNGSVETDLRTMLGQPTGNIIPSKVQLIAAQDNVVFDVVAHASTPQQAIAIANRAAGTFAVQLNVYKGAVASFVVVQKAIIAKKVPKFGGGHTAIAFGIIAGLLAGVALVGLILVIRRPVVDASTAQSVTGSPVIGRVSLPRHGPPTKADSRSVGLLARRLLTTSASTVHVAAPTHSQAERLATLVGNVYDRMRAERRQQNRQGGKSGSSRMPTVVAPEDAEAWTGTAEDESYTVLMVPTGISSRKLRRLAEWHDTGAPTGLVLVTAHRGHGTTPTATPTPTPTATPTATPTPTPPH